MIDLKPTPVAWRYELAERLVLHADGRQEWKDYRPLVSLKEPLDTIAGLRNITPLFEAG